MLRAGVVVASMLRYESIHSFVEGINSPTKSEMKDFNIGMWKRYIILAVKKIDIAIHIFRNKKKKKYNGM